MFQGLNRFGMAIDGDTVVDATVIPDNSIATLVLVVSAVLFLGVIVVGLVRGRHAMRRDIAYRRRMARSRHR
ncbi:MAG: hypothetical protein JWM50_1855 [Microbacteriaceae bacterium]|jgi:hypothetical protein|nr:hypothetical protein [Microbacteriaceae bacterium]